MIEEKPSVSSETPDPQVKQETIRCAFTTTYKLSILEQADERSAYYWPDKTRGGAVVERIRSGSSGTVRNYRRRVIGSASWFSGDGIYIPHISTTTPPDYSQFIKLA